MTEENFINFVNSFLHSLIFLKSFESLPCYLSGTVPGTLNIKMKIIQYLFMGIRVHAR